MKILYGLTSLLLLGLAAPALAGDVTVTVGHGRLAPAEVTVAPGDKVTWNNVDQMPGGHSVVADDGSFASPSLDKDEKWSHTFERTGRFLYHIGEHPDAKGNVTVE